MLSSTRFCTWCSLYYQVLLVCTPAAGRNLVMLSSTRFCTWYPVVPSTGHQKMVLWYLVPGTRYHDDTSGRNLVLMHSSTGITAPAQCCWYQVGRSMVPGCTFIHSLLSAPLILLLALLYLSLRILQIQYSFHDASTSLVASGASSPSSFCQLE